jgi:hypothetical protein
MILAVGKIRNKALEMLGKVHQKPRNFTNIISIRNILIANIYKIFPG